MAEHPPAHRMHMPMQNMFAATARKAKDVIANVKHTMSCPDDASAQMLGRMVSKDYGAHEKPHTEHHMWQSGHTPPMSPRSPRTPGGSRAANSAYQQGVLVSPMRLATPPSPSTLNMVVAEAVISDQRTTSSGSGPDGPPPRSQFELVLDSCKEHLTPQDANPQQQQPAAGHATKKGGAAAAAAAAPAGPPGAVAAVAATVHKLDTSGDRQPAPGRPDSGKRGL